MLLGLAIVVLVSSRSYCHGRIGGALASAGGILSPSLSRHRMRAAFPSFYPAASFQSFPWYRGKALLERSIPRTTSHFGIMLLSLVNSGRLGRVVVEDVVCVWQESSRTDYECFLVVEAQRLTREEQEGDLGTNAVFRASM